MAMRETAVDPKEIDLQAYQDAVADAVVAAQAVADDALAPRSVRDLGARLAAMLTAYAKTYGSDFRTR